MNSVYAGPLNAKAKHAAASGKRRKGSTDLDPKRSITAPMNNAKLTVVNAITSNDVAKSCGGQSFKVVK